MSIKEIIIELFWKPILSAIIGSLFLSAISQIITGNWFVLFTRIPIFVWFIIVLLLIIWTVIIIIRNAMKYQMSSLPPLPQNHLEIINQIPYDDIIWNVGVPRRDQLVDGLERLSGFRNPRPNRVRIEYPPRCPRCRTELNIIEHYLWYSWRCDGCGFIKRTWNSVHKSREEIERIANRINELNQGM